MVTSAALIMVAAGTDTIMTMNWRMPVLSGGEVDLPAVSWIAGSYWVLGPPAAGVAGCRCTAGTGCGLACAAARYSRASASVKASIAIWYISNARAAPA